MLTNNALNEITDFLQATQTKGVSAGNYIQYGEAESFFAQLTNRFHKELRDNLLNLPREEAALYLCEVVENLSLYSDLISPSNDEINEYLKQHDDQMQLRSIIKDGYSEALTQAIGKPVEFKVDIIPQDLFREEELRTLFAFREKLYAEFANQNEAALASMPEEGWAWIYAEQVSAFLEDSWLKVIELYERRCGNVPESLHWNSHSQFVKQHSQERFLLSVNEAINTALLRCCGVDVLPADLNGVLEALKSPSTLSPEPERTQAPATGQRRASEPKTAKMRDTFTVDDVRAILRSTDMGIRYNEPGEWAAAFRALHAKGILTGGATAIKRWADSTGYGGNFSKSTLIIPWRDEWNEPADTNNEAQRLVFKSIADSCQSLLNFRQLQA